jgi:carbon-monoxide dehydrogenase small subunit
MPHSAAAKATAAAPSATAVPITVTVNGVARHATVEPRTLFVSLLRETLGLTGTHVGCDTSQCGACAVLVDGAAVKACTLLAVQADGANVTTIEGLAPDGALHPVQQAFWEAHGSQCGFCTPGMVLATCDLLSHTPNPTEAEIRHGLEGNYCRCTGYHNIVKAVQLAASRLNPK